MKKGKILAMSCLATVCLTGCGMTVKLDVSDKKVAEVTTEMSLSKSEASTFGLDEAAMKQSGFKKTEKNGKTEYVMSQTEKISYGSEDFDATFDRTHFYITENQAAELTQETIGDAMNELDSSYQSYLEEYMKDLEYDLKIKFPSEVVVTNGEVSKNDKSEVTFDLMNISGAQYAYTSDYKDNKKPVIKGVEDGKTYTKSVKVKFSDKSALKTKTLDGKTIKSGKKVSAKGAHTLIVEDVFGNKTVVKFTIK